MQYETRLYYIRVGSVVASTLVSLACGTNYAFSAWGPSFAQRMELSSTEINLIAVFGNLGMYLSGIPIGVLTDARGPKPGTIAGAILVSFGYFMMHLAYINGPGSISLWLLCIFMFFTGLGGCMAFAGAIKTSATNWPRNRGTATAFPLAAFGLSAFFFATVAGLGTAKDTGAFLLVLAVGTFLLLFVPSFFLYIVPETALYEKIPATGERNRLHSMSSAGSRKRLLRRDAQYPNTSNSSSNYQPVDVDDEDTEVEDEDDYGPEEGSDGAVQSAHKSVYADVRGIHMLKYVEFYQYFALMGVLTGIGIMTINNIGNDAQALWTKFDPTVPIESIRHRQSVHVSILSLCSFTGRLISGIGSDLVVLKLHMSRVWCLFASAVVFAVAQIFGLSIENPGFLFILSGLTGLAYGFLFGVFPSAIAETFGVEGLTTNWGVIILAPVICTNLFNIIYGKIYDAHSDRDPSHDRACLEGRYCYHEAYLVTFAAAVAAICISLWSIWYQKRVKDRINWKEGDDEQEEHLA